MPSKPRIAIVVGSTRPTRFADKPAQWMLKQAQARDDIEVELVDLRDHTLPFFDEKGLEYVGAKRKCRSVALAENHRPL
jgi:NAD(P)H-dependent FMN reductase